TLAQRVHMSRASFAQLFRDVSATTPLAVLTTLRLQIAAQTLSREALPVMVIAESVGYASESSFHKAFVREFGCTPGEYRKRVSALGR
ncbi:AraC family transcriptional regulator, partial [Salmonella enterica]